jgi:CheY-like chemotaxis protein
MPVMSGIEAAREIRMKGNSSLSIVALTAAAVKEGREQCFKAGMNDFLTQPIHPQKLKQKIMEWSGVEKTEDHHLLS